MSIRAARNLPGGGLSPDTATAALRSELLEAAKSQAQVIVGVDSPPSIAKQFIAQKDWATWVAKFFRNYPTPAAFRKATSLLRSGHCKKSRIEPKRMTDVRHKTPLAPQNLRMYKQTWWAITGVYLPLAQSGFCVAPCMPIGRKQKHLLMESCPASLLKRLDLYSKPYKGKDVKHVQRRRFIMKSLKFLGSYEYLLFVSIAHASLYEERHSSGRQEQSEAACGFRCQDWLPFTFMRVAPTHFRMV